MKNASIKDIAALAGVSTTTISFVLNGKAAEKRISKELVSKIEKIAKKLNYTPNQIARGLRTGKTHSIGLMVEDISNPFFGSLAKVIEDEADKHGYKLMYCSTENNETRARDLLKMLEYRQMDGFIITPTVDLKKDIELLVQQKKPLVLIDRYFPDYDTSYVAVDNYKGAYEAVSFLIAQGHKNVGLVTISQEQVQMKERYRGYLDALKDHGQVFRKGSLLRIPFDAARKDAVHHISEFLQRKPRPDALFFTTNYLGIYGLESLRELGMRIPEDIGMVVFDDHDLFRLYTPAITVISQPITEIGKLAVDMLIGQLSKKPRKHHQHTLAPTLMVRASSKSKK